MGDIVRFERGCETCSHCMRVGKDRYRCELLVHEDDTDIIVIDDDAPSMEYNICFGKRYERSRSRAI